MKVTLDTNVLIAAFVARGTCHELYTHVGRTHNVILSQYIVDEMTEKLLAPKFNFSQDSIDRVVANIWRHAILVEPAAMDIAFEDADDIPVLGTAVAGKCDALITGDKALIALGKINNIPIIPPAQFWVLETAFDN